MFQLFPREESFLPQFARAAEIILEAATALDQLAADFTDVELKVAHIKHLEHEGDQVAHQTFGLLSRTWITPIDREDICSALVLSRQWPNNGAASPSGRRSPVG